MVDAGLCSIEITAIVWLNTESSNSNKVSRVYVIVGILRVLVPQPIVLQLALPLALYIAQSEY